MTIAINPGSGPVDGASEDHAVTNMRTFVKDVHDHTGNLFLVARKPDLDERGRYGFVLTLPGSDESYEVEMPGLPLEQVRWWDEDSGSIWDFPRLYVDGSSWIWKFAIACCEPDEDEEATG